MKRTVILTVSLLALAALAVAAPAVQAKGGPGTRIALKSSGAFPGASGKAKFQNDGQRELEDRGRARAAARRQARQLLREQHEGRLGAGQPARRGAGQPPRASFLAINAGTRIKVKTAGGRLIVSGSF